MPRFLTLHQLARRTGINRNALTMLMARGQITPTALLDFGDGRDTFLFPEQLLAVLRNRNPQS